ncbi:hypothetical protein ACWDA3_27820 [Nonomuraea rubra]
MDPISPWSAKPCRPKLIGQAQPALAAAPTSPRLLGGAVPRVLDEAAPSRYRPHPTPSQEAALAEHCGHARYVEPGRAAARAPDCKSSPGFAEQCRQ